MKKVIWLTWYSFDNIYSVDPKTLNKYLITLTLFGRTIDFRFMKQDDSFYLRCENLYAMWLRFNWKYLTNKDGRELPF